MVLRFGKYHATTMPGLHFKLPMIDQVLKVSVEEHGLRLPFGAQSSGENVAPVEGMRQVEEETLMLTGDLNTASVEWTVAWRVTEPSEYLFRFPRGVKDEFATDLITFVSRTVMNRLVGDYSFDEVIGPKRSDIANEARGETQRILDAYKLRHHHHRPANAARDPARSGQAGLRQGQRRDPAKAEAGERGRVGAEQAASRGEGVSRQADPRGRRLRVPPPGRGPGRDRGPAGQVPRLSAGPRGHPAAALHRGHARSARKREGQDHHRCRSQAVPSALEPGFEGRSAANEPVADGLPS